MRELVVNRLLQDESLASQGASEIVAAVIDHGSHTTFALDASGTLWALVTAFCGTDGEDDVASGDSTVRWKIQLPQEEGSWRYLVYFSDTESVVCGSEAGSLLSVPLHSREPEPIGTIDGVRFVR